ncbi:MAG: hypothetical protein Q9218_000353 [Villophora microphyllina]
MAQFETNFSTSPLQTTTSPPNLQNNSTASSGLSTNSSKSRQNTGSPPTDGTNGAAAAPQPNPRSCVTCRKRKVRCDKRHPCSNCSKADIECVFPGPGRAPRRSRKPPDAELLARLRRLEGVVQHLGKNLDEEGEKGEEVLKDEGSTSPNDTDKPEAKPPAEDKKVPNSCGLFTGPEPRKRSVDGVSKEFGNLVVDEGRSRYVSNKFWNSLSEEIAEMRDILDDPTDDEYDYPSPGSGSSASANHQGFIFSFSSTILSLRNFHPPQNQIIQLWEVFKENVEPLVKIFHRPCTEKTVMEAAKDLDHISKPLEVMMFSIYFAAVTSLSDEQCMSMTGMDKESALKKYRFGFEQAMARAGFLGTTELVILQSFTIFLICVRRHDDTRFVWTMAGLLIRLAQALGLQRDGEQFGLSPFETEMRRRLWWQIVHVDLRASEDHGSEPSIQEFTFDTRFPLNINDDDISPNMKEYPSEHEGATEMTFDLIRYTVSATARRLSYVPPGPGKCRKKNETFTLEHKERLMEELHQHVENKYLKYCDMKNPLHWVAGTVLRLVLAKMWLVVHHPVQREQGADNKELSQDTKDRLFRTSVDIIQWSNLLEMEPSTKKWGWLFRTYVQWHAVAFVLSQLCIRVKGPEVERAWQVIGEIFGDLGGLVGAQKRGMLWKPLRRLIARAQAVRARELEKQRMFPLDGTLGMTTVGVSATAMDPISNSNGNVLDYTPMSYGNGFHGLSTLNSPVPNSYNGLQTYPPLDASQPALMNQNEWMYNDPAFPETSQAFEMAANGNTDMTGLELSPSATIGEAASGELNWSDWDEMMKDLPMGTEQVLGFGSGGGASLSNYISTVVQGALNGASYPAVPTAPAVPTVGVVNEAADANGGSGDTTENGSGNEVASGSSADNTEADVAVTNAPTTISAVSADPGSSAGVTAKSIGTAPAASRVPPLPPKTNTPTTEPSSLSPHNTIVPSSLLPLKDNKPSLNSAGPSSSPARTITGITASASQRASPTAAAGSNLSAGVKAAIALGIIVVVLIVSIAGLLWWRMLRSKRRRSHQLKAIDTAKRRYLLLDKLSRSTGGSGSTRTCRKSGRPPDEMHPAYRGDGTVERYEMREAATPRVDSKRTSTKEQLELPGGWTPAEIDGRERNQNLGIS